VIDSHRFLPIGNPRLKTRNRPLGLIRLRVADRSTAGALAEVLNHAGYATIWNPIGQPNSIVRGAAAGIWDGGQLDERELRDLANFCGLLSRDAAPVLALLDFPRADRVDVARQLGAIVLGKPWINADLIALIDELAGCDTNIDGFRKRAA
jgi:hypothetical protein